MRAVRHGGSGGEGIGANEGDSVSEFLPPSISVIVIFVVIVYLSVSVSKARDLYKDESKLERVSINNNHHSDEHANHLEGVLIFKTKVVELQRAKSQDLGTWTLTLSMMVILTTVML